MDTSTDKSNIELLKEKVAVFPAKPGVYLMKNFDGQYLYIGKAKDLRARVRTYVSSVQGDGRVQIKFLMDRVATIEYILTTHEEEALLLERELIHRHKPRYNIRLKDDKAYISVRVNRQHPYPRIETVWRVIPDGAEYFGPFPSTYQLREVLEIIKKVVPLRSCSDSVFANRMRPCLEYEIKRCAGPCCLHVDNEQYEHWLTQAIDILEGKIDPTISSMEQQMEQASLDLRFEEAASIRDRIETLTQFKNRGSSSVTYDFSCDVFTVYREQDLAIVALLRTRQGRMYEVESFSFRDVHISDNELLESVIQQYYEIGHELPAEIVLSIPLPKSSLLESYFKERHQISPVIEIPEQGPKHRLVRICEINANQAFQNKFFSETQFEGLSQELLNKFKLRQGPRRIECVDISNLQGSDIVGAIVSFVDGIPDKKRYRRYNISFSGAPNDFEAIYEVVKRRLVSKESLPDLLIIDGGRQQLAKALLARDELGITLDIISLAKIRELKLKNSSKKELKPERIFVEGEQEAIPLDEADPVTHFLQRVRDEVHRYVITFHRHKRKVRVMRSVLDDIPGIGPERRQRLLAHFGSIDQIKNANEEQVAKVGRMSILLARKLLGAIRVS